MSYSYRAALPGALWAQFWIFSQFTPLWVGSPEGSSVPSADGPAAAMPPPHCGLCPGEKAASFESNVKEEAF